MAAIAIWLIATGPTAGSADNSATAASRQTMALAILAGLGFGFYFIALKMASPAGVLWPMASARIGSLCVCSLLFLGVLLRPGKNAVARLSLNRTAIAWALGTALLDTSGNLLFVAATRAGRLDVAAVLASLYPASTILLAALALGEWPTRRQAMGMAAAALAVVLIAL
jgi:drug/metabolite transporter (DMT)-like permease